MNFGGLPRQSSDFDTSRIVVLPVPYDGTSTWGKGADRGPFALLEASANMELYDIETDSEVYRHGIFTDEPIVIKASPAAMVQAVRDRVSELLKQGKFVVTVGGEHSVSVGAILACAEAYPGLTLLQLDAHADLRQTYRQSKFNHACVMARAREVCSIVQVGIRSMELSEKPDMKPESVFWADDLDQPEAVWMPKVVGQMGPRVYITIDLDVLDPSIMPSTGTPEPGGMLWRPLLRLLRAVIAQREVVAADIVELCPMPGNRAPDFLAAKLLYKLLSYRFAGMPPFPRPSEALPM